MRQGMEELQNIFNLKNFAGFQLDQIKSNRGKSIVGFLTDEKTVSFLSSMMKDPDTRGQFVSKD
jgi:hypothetical protein